MRELIRGSLISNKAALDKHCFLIPAQAGQKRMAH
jgi:hypothetical protein